MTKKQAISIILDEVYAYAFDHLKGDDEYYDDLRKAVKILEGAKQ